MNAQADPAEPSLAPHATGAQHDAPATPAPAAAISQPVARPAEVILPDARKVQRPAAVAQPQTEQAQATHGYDFSAYANEDNAARYDSFGTIAKSVSATPEQVAAFARWDQEQAQELAKLDEQIFKNDVAEIRRVYSGGDFDEAAPRVIAFVNAYSGRTRDRLDELAATPDGFRLIDGWSKHAPVDLAAPAQAQEAKPSAKVGSREYWAQQREQDAAKRKPNDPHVVGASTRRFVPT
jgi:hypothetical protein